MKRRKKKKMKKKKKTTKKMMMERKIFEEKRNHFEVLPRVPQGGIKQMARRHDEIKRIALAHAKHWMSDHVCRPAPRSYKSD